MNNEEKRKKLEAHGKRIKEILRELNGLRRQTQTLSDELDIIMIEVDQIGQS